MNTKGEYKSDILVVLCCILVGNFTACQKSNEKLGFSTLFIFKILLLVKKKLEMNKFFIRFYRILAHKLKSDDKKNPPLSQKIKEKTDIPHDSLLSLSSYPLTKYQQNKEKQYLDYFKFYEIIDNKRNSKLIDISKEISSLKLEI